MFLQIQKIITQIKPFELSQKDQLAILWSDLEKRANCSVFLSWQWISNWLSLVSKQMFVVEAYQGSKIVGLGIMVEQQRKAFGLLPIKQWYLHRTGIEQQDQIWTEYNDFLLDQQIADEVRDKMVSAINCYDKSVQEFVIGLSSNRVTSCFEKHFKHSAEQMTAQGYSVDFSEIKDSYLETVPSKNTRSQIKRSDKLLSQMGILTFDVVTDKNQVKALFSEISKLHIVRWQNTREGSGFTNELFKIFHQRFINGGDSTVQISVLSLDNKALGYLVNFVYNDRVYFYLSALTTSANNKIKIGLSLHSKAIQYYLSLKLKTYDFLGGEARYKQSLSNSQYVLSMKSFNRNSYILIIESAFKIIKSNCKLLLLKYTD